MTSYAGCRCLRARYFERVHDEFMSRGTKRPRSAPGGSGGERGQVWIFTPEDGRELPAQKDLRSQAMELADDRELVAKVRRTRRRTVTGGPDAHKPFDLVEPRDAGELYAAVHRHRVLVLALSASWVRSDPGEASARWRHVRRLEEFVSYKAAYCMVRGPGDPERAVSEFGSWPVSGSCTTTDDPRVLPLHVFDHSQAWLALGTPSGAATFAAVHGQPRAPCRPRRTHLVSGAPRPWQRRPDCVGTPVADGVSLGRSAWSRRRTARHLSRGLEARSSWLIRERLSRCLRASRGTVRAPSMARVAGLLRLCGCSV